jgi:hypothetical protein
MYFEQTLSIPKKSKYFKIFFKYKLSISNSQEIVLNIQLIISQKESLINLFLSTIAAKLLLKDSNSRLLMSFIDFVIQDIP